MMTYGVIKNHVKINTQRKGESRQDFIHRCCILEGTIIEADKMTFAAPYMSPHVLADIMGHKRINTTMRDYIGLPIEHLSIAHSGMSKISFESVSNRR